ncbi:hypothetical protein B0E46_04785 [Rhodanobacter sp. B04]|nr:hypothetical protein B0E46_04785 [Rhodanobacter sp. B04]
MKDMDIIATSAFEFETRRMRLRLLNSNDEALFCSLYTDPSVMRFIGPLLSARQAASRFQWIVAGMRQLPASWLYLVMSEKESGQSLGICGVPQFSASATRFEVGLVLTSGARSRGYAREGLAALMERLFSLSSVDEIQAKFFAENQAARQLVVALGFRDCTDASMEPEHLRERTWSIHRAS